MSAFPRRGGSFDGHGRTCNACLGQDRDGWRARQRDEWRATHLLGGCLETLRDEAVNLIVERVGKPGIRKPLPAVIEAIATQAPNALDRRAQIVYEEAFYDAREWESGLRPGDCIATVSVSGPQGWTPWCRVFVASPRDAVVLPPAPPLALPPLPPIRAARPLPPGASRDQWRAWARGVLAEGAAWALIDTETTGLRTEADEIVEVAAVDMMGAVLVDTLVRPAGPIPPFIQRKTGITPRMTAGAPPFAEVYARHLQSVLAARKLLAFNADFDIGMLRHNIRRACATAWQPVAYACLQRAFGDYRADGTLYSLERACAEMGVEQPQAHRALGDCLASLALLRAMAEG